MQKTILYSSGKNDECYTPDYGVKPIIKYLYEYNQRINWDTKKGKKITVWCPFDKEWSQFVIQIKQAGFKVIHSHIDEGKDFFEYEPKSWDVIISNPPFNNKRQFFERALSFGKPFALIMTNTRLNDSAPVNLFKDKGLQLLMFDKRIRFNSPDGRPNNKITFSSSYYCYKFLPKTLILEELQK